MPGHLTSIGRTVAKCLARRKEIQAAYLFGSVTTGRMRRDSDVDIAVLLGRYDADGLLSYRLKLLGELGFALHRSDVELIVLNEAPPLLAHRVLSTGRLVLERSPSARIRFHVATANRYADLVPMFETHIRDLKKSVREGRVIG